MSRAAIHSGVDAAGAAVTNLIDLVQAHVAVKPQAIAYTFQPGQRREEQRWSWADLDRRARSLAAELQQAGMRGRPVLVLQPAGLEYVACFLGCLYAGAIAVPAYPPDGRRMGQSLARLAAIVADSRTTLALTTSEVRSLADAQRTQLASAGLLGMTWLATDTLDDGGASRWQAGQTSDGLALLQYTSGSTATPKGVMVSHGNLLANLRSIHRRLQHDEGSGMVSWLPPFHDMGLIGGILSPLYGGFTAHLMGPETFVARPLLWLQTLSRTRASTSVSPNFGFEHCLRRVRPEDKASLDLSHWRLALNGAEPIRPATLARFAAYFADCGFDAVSLLPCYGLAEATLMVTGERANVRPRVRNLDKRALGAGQAQPADPAGPAGVRVVSCGSAVDGVDVRIVHPDRPTGLPDGHVGEVWVHGPNVARGYWRRPEESARIFRAELDGKRWLRTGDLGFTDNGELYLVGRSKDLVILSGRNIYPHDIEQAVEACSSAIRPGAVAAFGIEVAGAEELVIAAELERHQGSETGQILADIRRAIAAQHEVSPHAVVLVKRSSLAKTTSGKIQRRSCRTAFHNLQLDIIAASVLAANAGTDNRGTEQPTAELVATEISQALGKAVGQEELRGAATLAELSVDYPCLLQVLAALQPRLAIPVEPGRLLQARTGAQLLAAFGVPDTAAEATRLQPVVAPAVGPAVGEVERWLRSAVAVRLAVPADTVALDQPLRDLGLDSKNAVALADDLAVWLDRPVSGALVFDRPTIRELASALGTDRRNGDTPSTDRVVTRRSTTEPIAIIGIGCRLPGAADVNDYWRLLCDGRDATSNLQASRWDPIAAGTPERAGLLDNPAGFDARLFGISGREADLIDPQQRLMLDVAWQALDDAGIAARGLRGSDTGVFVGISSSDYAELTGATSRDVHAVTGNAHSLAANRISYSLDLCGPSLAVDTACSSSLVAVHLAARSLRAGECTLALAGGVNLILTPGLTTAFARAGMLAPDSTCRTFDQSAAGYVRGEGAAVVCLKPLSAAVAAGDRIYGVIAGSALGHGGRGNGITAPRPQAQERVIRAALAEAEADPKQIGYVEAHGTGTALGDPIEWEALCQVYGDADRSQPCLVGSVKPSIGHLEAAAGIAGLIKAALVLHHGHIPAQLHFTHQNKALRRNTALTIADRPADLPSACWVAVSSFGFGGANAHLLLRPVAEHQQPSRPQPPDRTVHALALSGHTDTALIELAHRWRQHLSSRPELGSLAELAAAQNTGRSHLAYRAVLIAADRSELDAGLTTLAATGRTAHPDATEDLITGSVDPGAPPRLAMLFSGQGSQHPGMGRTLYETHHGFAASLDRAERLLSPVLGRSLLDLILKPENASALRRTRYCQPALAAFQIALLQLWASLGIRPDAVLGHSIGALAAAHAAGVLSADDALLLAAERGRLMDQQPGEGAMLACAGDEQQIRDIATAAPGLVVAAENAPGRLVLSGGRELIESAAARLADAGVATRMLEVSHAFHSPFMAGAAESLRAAASRLPHHPVRTCWISDTTGQPLSQATPEYWVQQLLQPVHFATAVRELAGRCDTFLEIGPHPTLIGLARRTLRDQAASWLPSLARDQNDWRQLLRAAAALYVVGAPIDWSGLDLGRRRNRVPVPLTVQQRTHHWLPSAAPRPSSTATAPRAPAEPSTQASTFAAAGNQSDLANPVPAEESLLRLVARIGGFDPQQVNPRLRLGADLGFDSLMRTELHRSLTATYPQLSTALRHSLPEDPTVADLIQLIGLPIPANSPPEPAVTPARAAAPVAPTRRETRFSDWPEYRELQERLSVARRTGSNPYGRTHDGFNGSSATINGRSALNFSTFNYLGLSHHPRLLAAAKAAIDTYGTSSSATPLLCGETPLHHQLDTELASFLGTDDAVVFAGGHATNVATVGHLFGPEDLVVHDAWIHDSSVRGAILSGARRRPFPHNDWQALDNLLNSTGDQYRRIVIVIEGAYSQDGDLPDLPAFIRVKQRHQAMLMVDEAHSIGVLGATGRGIGEHYRVDRSDVDLWMGTISKALGSLGGYIAANREIVTYLKYTTPLYIFSTGISPANAAAALEAVRLIRDEPDRVQRLQELSEYFRSSARDRGFDIGVSRASAVVPVIVGDWDRAMRISNRLLDRGINVMPIGYPAVDRDACRLRFFVNVEHSEADLDYALHELGAVMTDQLEPRTTTSALPPPAAATEPTPASSRGAQADTADVLVTGATGFIGGHLARELVNHGYRVRVLVRPNSDLSALSGLPVEPVIGDLTDPDSLQPALTGIRHVYHCAGLSADWGSWQHFNAINVEGATRLAQAAAGTSSLERFVHVSTTDVFGYPASPCDENGSLTDTGLPYNRSKLRGEQAVRAVAERSGMPLTVIRPVSVYGPRSKDFVVEIANLLLKKQMVLISRGAAPAGLIYIDNLTEAMIAACETEAAAGRAYNLRDTDQTTWRQYITALATGIGAAPPSFNLPSPLATGIAHTSEAVWRTLRLKSRPLLTRHAVRLFDRDQSYGIECAQRDFGFKSRVGFEQGMRLTLDWLHTAEGRAAVPAMPAGTDR